MERGWIYFVKAGDAIGGAVKIGWSLYPEGRLLALQTGNHQELEMLGIMRGSVEDERVLHAAFSDLHIRGEWFLPGAELMAYVRKNTASHRRERPKMPLLAKSGLQPRATTVVSESARAPSAAVAEPPPIQTESAPVECAPLESEPSLEPLLTAREVAGRLGIANATVLDWWEAGKVPGFKLNGRAVRFRWSEIQGWLEAGRSGTGAA